MSSRRVIGLILALFAVVVAAVAIVVAVTGDDDEGGGQETAPQTPVATPGVIRVQTSENLLDFTDALLDDFEEKYPEIDVDITTSSVKDLIRGVRSGEDLPDLVVAANPWLPLMKNDAASADERPLANGFFLVVTPPANPGGITALADFGGTKNTVACGKEAGPYGNLAALVLKRASVGPPPETVLTDCTNVGARVAAGELDGALLFSTDVPKEGVEIVPFPTEFNIVIGFTSIVFGNSDNAQLLSKNLSSDAVKKILTDQGFLV